jgi:hypothetical protein
LLIAPFQAREATKRWKKFWMNSPLLDIDKDGESVYVLPSLIANEQIKSRYLGKLLDYM